MQFLCQKNDCLNQSSHNKTGVVRYSECKYTKQYLSYSFTSILYFFTLLYNVTRDIPRILAAWE